MIPIQSEPALYVLLVSAPVLAFGVVPWLMQGLTQTANDVADVLLIDDDAAFVHVIEAEHQPDDGRFASARAADHGE